MKTNETQLKVLNPQVGVVEAGSRAGEARAVTGEAGAAENASLAERLSERGLDCDALRASLSGKQGPALWRSLDELLAKPEVAGALAPEFPPNTDLLDPVSRRDFLKLASATLALAGITACTKQPLEPIVPYVQQPEGITLGKPLYYATAMPLGGILRPIVVKSHEGRPTKVEGNAQHPASQGGTGIFAQAAIYGLYDPDRSQTVEYLGDVRTWPGFLGAIRGQVTAQKALGGAGLRFLTGSSTSPTLASQIKDLQRTFPQMKWHRYEPLNRDMVKLGAQQAFGQIVETRYDLSAADVILSLDANFLSSEFPGFERYARDFAARRQPGDPRAPVDSQHPMLRFYAVETAPTTTGGKADHRIGLKPSEFAEFVETISRWTGSLHEVSGVLHQDWYGALAPDLSQSHGRSVIIAGDYASPEIHALAHQMNAALGNVGKTVFYSDPLEADPVIQHDSLRELVADLNAGKVDVLVMSGVNPVFDAPGDLDFASAIGKARLVIHHGLYADETSAHAHWHIPAAHFLESWSDGRSYDGTLSILQPLIAPLYGGKSIHEMVNAFSDTPETSGYDLLRGYWQQQHKGADFEIFWRRAVHDGFVANSAAATKTLTPKTVPSSQAAQPVAASNSATNGPLEIVFRPDPTIYDGSFANNAWLQEIEKPLSTITWDNVIWISAATAQQLGYLDAAVKQRANVMELELNGRRVRGPLYVQPGMPDGTLAVFTGYGHTHIGHTGNGFGYNAYAVRPVDTPWSATGAKLTRTHETVQIAMVQPEQRMQAGDLGELHRRPVRIGTLDGFRRKPNFAQEGVPSREDTLLPNYTYTGYAWAMAIDLNSCVGCNACIAACQAENNIPVVGKRQVLNRRAMNWLRVDTYYDSLDNPRMYFQPLPCMQCENAPCEYVCPVGATVHSTEGLNDMVYNRCVGTRYCSNNCPYKVRRFNFFLYQDWTTPQLKLMRNPEVSVRSRGVMEKCTYCVQRITKARISAEEQDRKVQDAEFTTACAQACPAGAIIFGDQNDKNSRVAKLKVTPRNYGLLEDLNTRPRTTYLAGVLNPNPGLHTPDVNSPEEQDKEQG